MRMLALTGMLVLVAPLAAQQPTQVDTTAMTAAQRAALRVESVRITVDSVRLTVGDTIQLQAVALDAAGQPVPAARVLFNVPNRVAVLVGTDRITGTNPGRADLRAFVVRNAAAGERPRMISSTVPLVVGDLPVAKVELKAPEGILYAGTTLPFGARAFVASGRESSDAELAWSVDRSRVATVDRFGHVTAVAPGFAMLSVKAGDQVARQRITVLPNPVAQLRISGGSEKARTGDVVRFKVEALNAGGRPVPGVVPLWTVSGEQTGDDLGARVWPDGAFVADEPARV